jgi:hypothetical protein
VLRAVTDDANELTTSRIRTLERYGLSDSGLGQNLTDR